MQLLVYVREDRVGTVFTIKQVCPRKKAGSSFGNFQLKRYKSVVLPEIVIESISCEKQSRCLLVQFKNEPNDWTLITLRVTNILNRLSGKCATAPDRIDQRNTVKQGGLAGIVSADDQVNPVGEPNKLFVERCVIVEFDANQLHSDPPVTPYTWTSQVAPEALNLKVRKCYGRA